MGRLGWAKFLSLWYIISFNLGATWHGESNGMPSGWTTNDIPTDGKVRAIIRGGSGWYTKI
jgi:hypothetical protein